MKNRPDMTKNICFFYMVDMANNVDSDQTAPRSLVRASS